MRHLDIFIYLRCRKTCFAKKNCQECLHLKHFFYCNNTMTYIDFVNRNSHGYFENMCYTCNHYTVEVKKIGTGFESIYKFNKNVHITFFLLKGVKNYFTIQW